MRVQIFAECYSLGYPAVDSNGTKVPRRSRKSLMVTMRSPYDSSSVDTQAKLRTRGRPRSQVRHDVADDLLRAVHDLLETKSPDEITLKEIADHAQTSNEMVRYYFGSKNGLMMAMLRQSGERIRTMLCKLEEDILTLTGNPTRHIVRTLVALYFAERPATRVSVTEFQKSKSVVLEDYLAKRSNLIVGKLHDIVCKLVDAGLYASTFDCRHAAVVLMTICGSPIRMLPALSPEWLTAESIADDPWIEHVVALCDGLYQA